MFRKILFGSVVFVNSLLLADIREIHHFDSFVPEVQQNAVVLLDVDETLIETPIMLGGKAWREYIMDELRTFKTEEEASYIHDYITYYLGKKISYIPIEKKAHQSLIDLTEKPASIFAFTARGKHHWMDMPVPDGEELAILHLKQGGFNLQSLNKLTNQELFSHWSYSKGIFFAYPIEDKGDLILELFSRTDYRPPQIIFVDDRLHQIRSVEKALKQLGIPAICFWYRHADLYRPFDPMTAHIQLEKLFLDGIVLSDEEAASRKPQYADKSPHEFFVDLISRLNFEKKIDVS